MPVWRPPQVPGAGSARAMSLAIFSATCSATYSAAVAVETLRIYEERDIVGHVRKVMGHFQDRLAKLGDHPLVGEARGVGLVGALEIVADKHSKAQFDPSRKAAALVAERAFDHGLIV